MFLSSLAGPQPCRSRFVDFAVLIVISVVFLLSFAASAVFAGFLLRGWPAGQVGWLELQADVDLGPDLKLRDVEAGD